MKGEANTMRALLTSEKYETINYDVCCMRRYSRNILQWTKTMQKAWKCPTGDYDLKKSVKVSWSVQLKMVVIKSTK